MLQDFLQQEQNSMYQTLHSLAVGGYGKADFTYPKLLISPVAYS